MTDFTPFEDLLRGHAGLLHDTAHDRWIRAQTLFAERAYREAAVVLRELLDDTDDVRHELTDVRLLLARALYHSAQLDGTIRVATELLEHDHNEPYAHLLVGRALQRKGRHDAGPAAPASGRTARRVPDLTTPSVRWHAAGTGPDRAPTGLALDLLCQPGGARAGRIVGHHGVQQVSRRPLERSLREHWSIGRAASSRRSHRLPC